MKYSSKLGVGKRQVRSFQIAVRVSKKRITEYGTRKSFVKGMSLEASWKNSLNLGLDHGKQVLSAVERWVSLHKVKN